MSGWTIPLGTLIEKAKGNLDLVARKTVLTVYRGVVMGTPVKTGAARGSWQATTGAPAGADIERLDPSGAKAIAQIQAENAKWRPLSGEVSCLTTLCRYMKRLNEGSSKQAPARFVELNVIRAGGIAEDAARGGANG